MLFSFYNQRYTRGVTLLGIFMLFYRLFLCLWLLYAVPNMHDIAVQTWWSDSRTGCRSFGQCKRPDLLDLDLWLHL
ncbi:hypothetical protein ACQKWADRAFT_295751, partial [Trichoderma austrokoningii]